MLLLQCWASAQALTWKQVQETRDFQNVREALSQYLPDLAIPRIQKLLLQEGLDATAKASLLTLLGEAEVRAGLENDALETLTDPLLDEFSPAHWWRGHALTQLGRFQDAIKALEKIDRTSMLEEASLQIAILQSALGNSESAIDRLVPLLTSSNPDLAREASLRMVALSLAAGDTEQAEKILATIEPEGLAQQGLVRYLKGRLQLERGERIAAIRTFQTLVNTPIQDLKLPAPLYHSATLSLADSLALESNFGAGITSLLETLEKFPNSPRIAEIFGRLDLWSRKSESEIPALMTKLADWMSPRDGTNTFGLIDGSNAGSFAVSSSGRSLALRSIYALHLVATFNLRSADPANQALALRQFDQLQALATREATALIPDSLIQIGLYHLKAGRLPDALASFELMRDFSESSKLQAYGNAFVGQVSLAMNEPAQASSAYLTARDLAEEAGLNSLETATTLNAGVAFLIAGDDKALDNIAGKLKGAEARAFILLERGLILADQRKPGARALLSQFLADYPENPRHDEAALALAENALFVPKDVSLARSQIASLKFDLHTHPTLAARHILVMLDLGTGEDQANEFWTKLPEHELAPRVLFQLGQRYRTGGELGKENIKIGDAYISFEKFLEAYPNHELVDAARFLGALAAMASGTEDSVDKALTRYQEVSAGSGPLASEARIARVSLLIDSDQQNLALTEIEAELESDDLPASDRYRLLILAADASGQQNNYEKSLGFYETLLAMPGLPIAWANRAHFHRGQIFERQGRNAEALESYFNVVNRRFDAAQTSTVEWKWFDKCGIDGALTLLQKDKSWRAALKLANRLASSGSPRSSDAAAIAARIGLEQQIFQGR
ncbi:tetratricopeptide repeat protein [Verrucomicrobiaceae bacterium 227]